MPKSRKKSGATGPSQFRLGAEVSARLDSLVAAFAAEDGDAATRSGVIRRLVNREYARRNRRPGK